MRGIHNITWDTHSPQAKRGEGYMASKKPSGKKIKLIAIRKKNAPRWADIRKFSLKRARTRRIRSSSKNWRRGRYKI